MLIDVQSVVHRLEENAAVGNLHVRVRTAAHHDQCFRARNLRYGYSLGKKYRLLGVFYLIRDMDRPLGVHYQSVANIFERTKYHELSGSLLWKSDQ